MLTTVLQLLQQRSICSHLAGVSLDNNVATFTDLSGFGGDGVRSAGIGTGEVVVVQLVLGGHGNTVFYGDTLDIISKTRLCLTKKNITVGVGFWGYRRRKSETCLREKISQNIL